MDAARHEWSVSTFESIADIEELGLSVDVKQRVNLLLLHQDGSIDLSKDDLLDLLRSFVALANEILRSDEVSETCKGGIIHLLYFYVRQNPWTKDALLNNLTDLDLNLWLAVLSRYSNFVHKQTQFACFMGNFLERHKNVALLPELFAYLERPEIAKLAKYTFLSYIVMDYSIRKYFIKHTTFLDDLTEILLDGSASNDLKYRALCVLWACTLSNNDIMTTCTTETVHALVSTLRKYGNKEKVIRRALHVISNLTQNARAMDQLLLMNILKVMDNLVVRDWHDEDILKSIHELTRDLTKFESELCRWNLYCECLRADQLEMNYLHTLDMWRKYADEIDSHDTFFLDRLMSFLEFGSDETRLVALTDVQNFHAAVQGASLMLQKYPVKQILYGILQNDHSTNLKNSAFLVIQNLVY